MLSSLAGADALEILVTLRDMSAAGLKRVESNIARVEGKANSANFSGFSSKSKTLATDAEKAAGKVEGGGGGIGNLIGSALGVPGPLLIAGAAVGGFAALAQGTIPVYERTQEELKQMAAAAKAHGISMDDLMAVQKSATDLAVKYGVGVDDVRVSMDAMTTAGLTAAQQQQAMPAILDLNTAKVHDMSAATDDVITAMMGNAKALKGLGILIPPVTGAAADLGKAQGNVGTATTNLQDAQAKLGIVEDGLKGKHKLTAAEALKLKEAHDKVTTAQEKLKVAQDKLTLAQAGGIDKGARLTQITKDITGATGDQSGTMSDLKQNQAKLGDAWDKFSNTVAPALVTALTAIVGVLATFVDALSNILGLIGKLPGADPAKIVSKNSGGNLTFVGGKYGAMPTKGGGTTAAGKPIGHYASGGWAGLHGPELAYLGEQGPEYVTPNKGIGGAGEIVINIHHKTLLDGKVLEQHLDKIAGKRLALMGSSGLGALGI